MEGYDDDAKRVDIKEGEEVAIEFVLSSESVTGVILLPDSWSSSTYGLNNANDKSALYSSNKISQRDWERRLEPLGAVFLPAAGYRHGHVFRVGTAGRYWSATEKSGNEAYGIGFTANDLITVYSENRKNGFSVRLVCDTE